jgi:hypothetical protein
MKRPMQTSHDDGRQRGSEHHRDNDANRRQRRARGRSKAPQRAGNTGQAAPAHRAAAYRATDRPV